MKRAILFYSLFLLSILIVVPQVVSAAHVPQVDFVQKVRYNTAASGEPEVLVDALDINGRHLYLLALGQKVTPIIDLGLAHLRVLYSGVIGDTNRKQVVVELPANILGGSYTLMVNNGEQRSFYPVTIGVTGARGVAGSDGTNGTNGTNGTDGADGADGTNGTNGRQGGKGDKGNPGSAGSNGTNGARGAIGPTGPAGNTSTKAWVNFNGRSSLSIRGKSGISTVTRSSRGEYTINFATPFANTSYVMTASASNGSVFIRSVSTSSITIYILNTAGRATDGVWVMLQFTSN